MSLEGFALITGAGSGIGRETVYTFAERGSTGIVCADLNEEEATATAETGQKLAVHPQFRSIPVKIDVTDRASVRNVIEATKAEFGRIDFNVNSAGVGAKMEVSIAEMPTEEFERTYLVNSRGIFFCTSEIIKVMQIQEEKFVEGRSGRRSIGRGSIVNVSSLNGQIPVPMHGQYGTSKFAALGTTLTAAAEVAGKGIRINCLLPSWVDTPMMAADFHRQADLPAAIQAMSPAGRMAAVEEVAESIHFLCSPGASYIHGVGLVVDAGFSLTRGLA